MTLAPTTFRSDIAFAGQLACILEVTAPKPGNVSPGRDFADLTYEDFLLSAAAIGGALGEAGARPPGETVLRAIRDTRRWVRTNTNLGIVLLFAPLARAAALGGGSLRSRLSAVLSALTVEDAVAVYEAIRLADPGGLGEVAEHDVRGVPEITLREAMGLAADRDAIAREYMTDFALTFEVAVPVIEVARAQGASWSDAALEAYLHLLSRVPDTLIARKKGLAAARRVSEHADRVLRSGRPGSPARQAAIDAFDALLRDPSHSLNPGTTADLTAAALFVVLLDQIPGRLER
jgi:triphosphoribosyl-dephospho-CoA synthase